MDWIFHEEIGKGQPGLKVQDLLQYSNIITRSGMAVPPGFVVMTGVFDEFMQTNGLTEDSERDEILSLDCPEGLRTANEEMWKLMGIGIAYAIRSSAISERGGVGIYKTTFFVKTRNKDADMRMLWEKERQVWASEFTEDAREWRKKQNKPIGMAIFVQEIPGKRFNEDEYAPHFAGTAYTSYDGKPMVRIVAGLGSEAVQGLGQVFNEPPDPIDLNFQSITLINNDGTTTTTGGYLGEEYDVSPSVAAFVIKSLFEKMLILQGKDNFYLEWAYNFDESGHHFWIVQCAPHKDKTLEALPEIAIDGMTLLTKSGDTVGHGTATCEHLVVVRLWCKDAVEMLESSVNPVYRKYMLVIPSQAICATAGYMPAAGYMLPGGMSEELEPVDLSLKYSYYSNASVILEWQKKRDEFLYKMMPTQYMYQPDHTDGIGGTHFQGVCSRTDILFVGSEFDGTILTSLTPCKELGNFVTVYKVQTKVIVDGSTKHGSVYIGKQEPKSSTGREYGPRQIEDWSMALRTAAIDLGRKLPDNPDPAAPLTEVMNSFYIVQYAMDPESGEEYNPFAVEPSIMEECGVDKVISCIETVIQEGGNYVDKRVWNSGFAAYLQGYRDYLVASKQQ